LGGSAASPTFSKQLFSTGTADASSTSRGTSAYTPVATGVRHWCSYLWSDYSLDQGVVTPLQVVPSRAPSHHCENLRN